jgi:hypothetical protein
VSHIAEKELALFTTGDLSLWRQNVVRLHVMSCRACAGRAEAYRADRDQLRVTSSRMPEGLDWERLQAEMTANIHLGLAAGECVSPRNRRTPIFKPHAGWAAQWLSDFTASAWKPVAAVSAVTILMAGAWWLNVPAADTQSLVRAFHSISRGGQNRMPQGVVMMDDRLPVVEVSASGVSVRENGSTLGMSQAGSRPNAVSVSVEGSASAHYVDAETGQVTVTSVYVE